MEAPPPQPPPPGPPAGAPPLPPPSMPTGQAPPPPPPSSQPSGGPDAAAASAPPPAQPPAPAPPMVDPLQANAPKHFEPPNNTIYINNLNEKVKEKELKKSLQAIFEQFGKILQIVAMSSVKRRGQAWVVFDNVDSAKKALAAMQSFPFCGKPMRINYSRNTSDVIAKANGTYQPRAKKPLGPKPTPPGTRPRVALPPAPLPPAPLPGAPAPPPPEDGQPPGKRVKQDPDGGAAPPPPPGAPQAAAPAPPATTMKLMPTEYQIPNAILFVQNLPEGTTQDMLTSLFGTYDGFKEVRLVPSRPDIAFVEYDSDVQSATALANLNNFKMTPEKAIVVSFAKK